MVCLLCISTLYGLITSMCHIYHIYLTVLPAHRQSTVGARAAVITEGGLN